MKELELYIHIPFCVKKCEYCDFLSFPAKESVQRRYVDSLIKEIGYRKDRETYTVSSVFFGGGTPSILPAKEIVRIMKALREHFVFADGAEISIECNPGTVDIEKLSSYQRSGINRLSFGLQSADNRELAVLGRIHTWEDFLQSFSLARAAGFDNINIDLMSALPGQTLLGWEDTLQKVLALRPEHISAYSLIIEEGTPFYARYADGEGLPAEEEERRIYERTGELLAEAGYRRYEISNYAQPGYECRHNIGYWKRTPYLGFGLGASSLLEEHRFQNTEEMTDYMERAQRGVPCFGEPQKLGHKEQMEEFMFLGLRLTQGICEEAFAKYFGKTIDEVYGTVTDTLCAQGLLQREDGMIRLTERGVDISNYVMAYFLLD